MKTRCPSCNTIISAREVNDFGYVFCDNCQRSFDIGWDRPLKEALGKMIYEIPSEITKNAPKGTWIKQKENSILIGGSLKSAQGLFFLALFSLMWEGGITLGLVGAVTAGETSLGLYITLAIFFIIGLVPTGWLLLLLFGKVEVCLNGAYSFVFTGIGNLGTKKVFDWDMVSSVYMGYQGSGVFISIKNSVRVQIARLSDERSYYIYKILKHLSGQKTGALDSQEPGRQPYDSANRVETYAGRRERETQGILAMEEHEPNRRKRLNRAGISADRPFHEMVDAGIQDKLKEYAENPPERTWIKQNAKNIAVGASVYSRIRLISVLMLIPGFIAVGMGVYIVFGIPAGGTFTKVIFCLFGSVFIIVGLAWEIVGLFMEFGTTEVVIGKKSYVFQSIGKLGIKRKFKWNAVNSIYSKSIDQIDSDFRYSKPTVNIYIDSNRRIKFGDNLNEDQQKYMLRILNYLHNATAPADIYTSEIDESNTTENIKKYIPKGAWIKERDGNVIVGATTRRPLGIFLLPFSVFFIAFLVVWTVGIQIQSESFNWGGVFGSIIFFLAGVFIAVQTLMAVAGKVEVVIGQNSYVFTGVGEIGTKKRFDRNAVGSVQIKTYSHTDSDNKTHSATYIILEGTGIKFGEQLNEKRREFLVEALMLHIGAGTRN